MTFPQGLGTALITPFSVDESIDYPALDKLLDRQIASKVDYLVVLGTTGEPATMLDEEQTELRRHIVQYVAGRKPLVLGVGGNCTRQVVNRLHEMHDELVQNYVGILSVCPYYNKPNQNGMYQHFVAVAKASPVPVILYNVPGRTGVNLKASTILRIYEAVPDKIIGIKEASGKVENAIELIRVLRGKVAVISGDDGMAYQVMQEGGQGLISVAANAFPDAFAQIVHEKKAWIQAEFEELIRLLFIEGSPSGIKMVLSEMGMIENVLRLPLVRGSRELQNQIQQELQHIH